MIRMQPGLAVVFLVVLAAAASSQAEMYQWEGNGHYYTAVPGNWQQAEAAAVGLGGHLVTVNDEREERWLAETFGPIAREFDPMSFWIGLSDAESEGVWTWSSGEAVTYTNWSAGEPSGSPGTDEDYAYVGRYADGTWNDVWPFGERSVPTRGIAEIVPEPATMALLGLGGLAAVVRRRRKR